MIQLHFLHSRGTQMQKCHFLVPSFIATKKAIRNFEGLIMQHCFSPFVDLRSNNSSCWVSKILIVFLKKHFHYFNRSYTNFVSPSTYWLIALSVVDIFCRNSHSITEGGGRFNKPFCMLISLFLITFWFNLFSMSPQHYSSFFVREWQAILLIRPNL